MFPWASARVEKEGLKYVFLSLIRVGADTGTVLLSCPCFPRALGRRAVRVRAHCVGSGSRCCARVKDCAGR